MRFAAACSTRKPPYAELSSVFLTSSAFNSANGPRVRYPALKMTRSGTPHFASTALNVSSTCPGLVASHFNSRKFSFKNFPPVRDATAISNPSFFKRRPSDALRPLPAPTISATGMSGGHRRRRAGGFARRALVHQPLQREGGDADDDQRAPGEVVVAGEVVDQAAHPGAEEGAELVAEEDDAVERVEVRQAEHAADDAADQRRHAQPQEAHGRGEHQRR